MPTPVKDEMWTLARDACNGAVSALSKVGTYRRALPEEEPKQSSEGDEEGYEHAWPKVTERRVIGKVLDEIVETWLVVQRLAYTGRVYPREWNLAVVRLVRSHVLVVLGLYEEMEREVSIEVLDMFHVLFMCVADVSLCIESQHPLREHLERLKTFIMPDDRQLHRYGEMAKDEDKSVSVRPNDFQ